MASNLSQAAIDYGIRIYAKTDDPHGLYRYVCPCGEFGPYYAKIGRCQRVAEAHYLVMHGLQQTTAQDVACESINCVVCPDKPQSKERSLTS